MHTNRFASRRLHGSTIGALAGTVLGFIVIANGLGTDARSADPSPAVARDFAGPVSFADVVADVSPAVVNISVEKRARSMPTQSRIDPGRAGPFDEFFERFFGPYGRDRLPTEPRVQAVGSGFVIGPDGLIATNNHVIDGAAGVVVRLQDGRELDATIVGSDAKTDLALLKVDTPDELPYVRFGDSDQARVGDWVLAIGNPFGLGGSATAGIISARGRDIQSGPYDDYLQIDAPINSGNSGGPIFNAAGEVIGINTAIFSPNGGNIGIGFAIPAEQAERVLDSLQATGVVTRGWLGVQIQDLDRALADSLGADDGKGALVSDVVAGSPAARGGIETGDIIRKMDDDAIIGAKDLSRVVAGLPPGQQVALTVLRNGNERVLDVELGDSGERDLRAAAPRDSVEPGIGPAGVALQKLSAADRSRLGLPAGTRGVLVVDVEPQSPAAKKGIRPGDVITEVDHEPIDSPDAAAAALNAAAGNGEHALLLVRRGDSQRFVALDLS